MSGSLLSQIRDLGRKRGRERRGHALAEGVRLVEEALAAGVRITGAATSAALEATARGAALKAALVAHGVPVMQVTEPELAELADTDTPQGIIAIIEPRRWKVDHIETPVGTRLLVCDAVQDPGNVGTMLRTAHALGATAMLCLPGTAELANPKVLRAAMGASFRLPAVNIGTDDLVAWLAERSITLWAGDMDGEPIASLEVPDRLALLVGNEGAGVSDALRDAAHRLVSIPIADGAESLSVGAAAAILLYEALRD